MEWVAEIPPVTRWWMTSIASLAILEKCEVLTRGQLVYNYDMIFQSHQYWRLFTTFMYFGPLDINLIVTVFLLARSSRSLEEERYRHDWRDYAWILFLCGGALVTVVSLVNPQSPGFSHLGPYLSNALTYLWARRNPQVDVSFMGLFEIRAPYLPWAQVAAAAVFFGTISCRTALIGLALGHVVFYFEDVFPRITDGKRPLAPPWTWMEERQGEHEHEQHMHQQPIEAH